MFHKTCVGSYNKKNQQAVPSITIYKCRWPPDEGIYIKILSHQPKSESLLCFNPFYHFSFTDT